MSAATCPSCGGTVLAHSKNGSGRLSISQRTTDPRLCRCKRDNNTPIILDNRPLPPNTPLLKDMLMTSVSKPKKRSAKTLSSHPPKIATLEAPVTFQSTLDSDFSQLVAELDLLPSTSVSKATECASMENGNGQQPNAPSESDDDDISTQQDIVAYDKVQPLLQALLVEHQSSESFVAGRLQQCGNLEAEQQRLLNKASSLESRFARGLSTKVQTAVDVYAQLETLIRRRKDLLQEVVSYRERRLQLVKHVALLQNDISIL